ncbi:MAG: hypothetical protein A2X12_10770 [Bacteroidetes bacterium GWE2_29_8]|nr:MAG: hypothetical protein A2X12_10770 [Bacteroidetes bacterium GWE2_29_8]OFY17421.1 MAG: hypothetical protein A2X02_00805 [Bacteroidetes bacterium GWF2_29_10]
MKKKARHILKLESKIENVNIIEKFINEICDYYHISSTYYGNILLAITEAFNNAVVHGNKLDEEKSVTISFANTDNKITFTVIDEGKGFDFCNIPDPTDPKNENYNHTGLFIIKSLSDGIQFCNNGNTIEISFNLLPINQEKYQQRVAKLQEELIKRTSNVK